MKPDEHATRYEHGNGRFDLMTDEEVRMLTGHDLQGVLVALAEWVRRGEMSVIGMERYHRLLELHQRYPKSDFRLEVIPPSERQEK